MSKLLGFKIRNISSVNLSIREDHLQKLSFFLKENFQLQEIRFPYEKNFGKHAFTQPIKKIKINKDIAELIGIILGDGNIHNNTMKIAFDRRNQHYLNYVGDLFNKIFGIKLKQTSYSKNNVDYLHCNNILVIEELLKLGLKRGNKIINQTGIPNWIKQNKAYSKACTRGLIDTDGCIYKCKRENQTYIKFTNFNQQLLDDFKELVENLDYHFAKANKNNWCLYRKSEVANFIKDIKPLKSIYGAMG